jgi:hypothetical protein
VIVLSYSLRCKRANIVLILLICWGWFLLLSVLAMMVLEHIHTSVSPPQGGDRGLLRVVMCIFILLLLILNYQILLDIVDASSLLVEW